MKNTEQITKTAQEKHVSVSATMLCIAFVAATMIANVMSLRMIAPFGVIMDAGTLLFPATFIIRDVIHRRNGLKTANLAVNASVLCNIAMFALFAFTAWLPADMATGSQEEFAQVLLPGVLIVLGSVVAQFISERIDGRIFHSIYRDGEGSHIKGVLISNLVSIPIDSTIMATIAFAVRIPFSSLVATIVANIVIKYVIMLVSVALYALAPSARERD